MTILVGYATAHGSTRSIAERIAAVLIRHGVDAEARLMDEVNDAGGYEAFVLGSAVHGHAWLTEAIDFVTRQHDVLAGRPVWLFSVGMPAALRGPWRRYGPQEEALLADELHKRLGARDHRLFSGVFRREHVPFTGHVICKVLGLRYGDYRDWTEIETWAAAVARELAAGRPASAQGGGR
ncbi:flavodoxin [Actinomadura soli]|uniref:Flavodoxin n=1 Tax=Actinomadura soli TaxID=2508997 RepID=A0A5C4JFL7_9ACTN|nr:flavodoxin domain-containing protein [Actinomadura soli]TMR04237.1 flavodoxin [Actinomadura soli]